MISLDFQLLKVTEVHDAEKNKDQKKVSNVSDLLNKTLGAPIDPEVKNLINSITDTCKLIFCNNETKEQKQRFMLKELQVSSFNELYSKDIDHLRELDKYLLELIPEEPPISDTITIDGIEVPAWDAPLEEDK